MPTGLSILRVQRQIFLTAERKSSRRTADATAKQSRLALTTRSEGQGNSDEDRRKKSQLIGRDGKNLVVIRRAVKRFFSVNDVKVV